MKLRVGLIGAGRMGKVYAHTLAFTVAEVDLVAVSDTDPRTSQNVSSRHGVKFCFTDYHELLKRDDIDAVVVATPTATHSEVIQAAATAGKHIFSEKPLSQTLEMCDQAIAAVAAAGVKLQLGFMRRFDPAYVLAKKKIDAGEIGRPVMFRSTGRDPRRTSLEFARRENSGGLIMDMGVHDFDLARWLMGSEVVRVSTEGACLVYPELMDVGDIDNAMINLKFANGGLGNIDLSRNAVYGYDIRTEVLGSDGGLLIGNLQQTATLVMTRAGVTHDTIPYFMERFGEAYAAQIRDFVACVLENRPPSVTGLDARHATAIGIAATRSLDEGQPVTL
ncbi:MAG: inositol 2-dehydrogenase [Anaerolineaceae bacterium]|nr:inositol 2-dehydrogenase [Anaerolineaceae bacterium]